jgi:hypothetical protein
MYKIGQNESYDGTFETGKLLMVIALRGETGSCTNKQPAKVGQTEEGSIINASGCVNCQYHNVNRRQL